jgi:hypothetical protein
MTLAEIEAALRQHFYDNWDSTDIAWPNSGYTPTTGSAWVRYSFVPGRTFGDEVGDSGNEAGHRNLVLKIQVFTPLASGTLDAADLAGQIEGLFRRQDISGVYTDEPYTNYNGSDGAWYQATVNIPGWAWV